MGIFFERRQIGKDDQQMKIIKDFINRIHRVGHAPRPGHTQLVVGGNSEGQSAGRGSDQRGPWKEMEGCPLSWGHFISTLEMRDRF